MTTKVIPQVGQRPTPLSMLTRWNDQKGRQWQIVEKLPFGRNLCTTTDRRFQAEWTHAEIRSAMAVHGGTQT